MKQYTIFEQDLSGPINIGESDELWQACAAAWSRAKGNMSATYVIASATGTKVDEYDCTYLALQELVAAGEDAAYEVDE